MSVPIQLSQSPVHEAFHGIVGDPLQKLQQLSSAEISLLQAGEANPLEYTLSDQHDAEAYAHVLLKVIDLCATSKTSHSSKSKHIPTVAKLSLSQAPLQDDEALQLLYVDTVGVVLHYAISKLTAVIQALHAMVNNKNRSSSSSSSSSRRKKKTGVVSVASIFYPTTTTSTTPTTTTIVLTEHCRRPLKRLLTGSMSDAYVQRGAAVCLAWILAAGLELSAQQASLSSSYINNYNLDDKEENDPLFGLVSTPPPTTKTTTEDDHDTSCSLSNSMESFVSWMTSRLASAKNASDLAIVLPALMVLMPSPAVRQAFDTAGGLAYLSRHLRVAAKPTTSSIHSTNTDDLYSYSSSAFVDNRANSFMRTTIIAGSSNNNPRASVQQLYELTYVVWLLSYDCCDVTKDRLRKQFYRDGVVSHLVDLVIAKPREKVVRVALATLKNLAQCHEQQPDLLTTMRIDTTTTTTTTTAADSLTAGGEQMDARAKVSKPPSSGSLTKNSPKRKQQPPPLGNKTADSSGLSSPLDALKLTPTASPRKRRTIADHGNVFSSLSSPIYKSSAFITGHDFCKEMVACGLLKPMDRMLAAAAAAADNNKVTDPDMLQDLQVLKEILNYTFRHMTSWDVYVSEIESTHLQWGIVHTEQFFRENVKRMEGEDGKFGIVRTLMQLALSEDEEVAAIACFDLGEFARHYPNGRALAKRLGARNVVMGLIEHNHAELQHQALTAVSKMLVLNWQDVT